MRLGMQSSLIEAFVRQLSHSTALGSGGAFRLQGYAVVRSGFSQESKTLKQPFSGCLLLWSERGLGLAASLTKWPACACFLKSRSGDVTERPDPWARPEPEDSAIASGPSSKPQSFAQWGLFWEIYGLCPESWELILHWTDHWPRPLTTIDFVCNLWAWLNNKPGFRLSNQKPGHAWPGPKG